MFKWLKRKKVDKSDLSILIDYFNDTGEIFVYHRPHGLTDEQINGLLHLVIDLIGSGKIVGLSDMEDINRYVFGNAPDNKPKKTVLRRIK